MRRAFFSQSIIFFIVTNIFTANLLFADQGDSPITSTSIDFVYPDIPMDNYAIVDNSGHTLLLQPIYGTTREPELYKRIFGRYLPGGVLDPSLREQYYANILREITTQQFLQDFDLLDNSFEAVIPTEPQLSRLSDDILNVIDNGISIANWSHTFLTFDSNSYLDSFSESVGSFDGLSNFSAALGALSILSDGLSIMQSQDRIFATFTMLMALETDLALQRIDYIEEHSTIHDPAFDNAVSKVRSEIQLSEQGMWGDIYRTYLLERDEFRNIRLSRVSIANTLLGLAGITGPWTSSILFVHSQWLMTRDHVDNLREATLAGTLYHSLPETASPADDHYIKAYALHTHLLKRWESVDNWAVGDTEIRNHYEETFSDFATYLYQYRYQKLMDSVTPIPEGQVVELTSGVVSPQSGTDSDTFEFSVLFRSMHGEPAENVNLVLDGMQEPMTPHGDDWINGVRYTAEKRNLQQGEKKFYFTAQYGEEEIRFPEEGSLTLNISIDAQGWDLAVSGNSAVQPSFANAGDRLNVSGAVTNRGEYTYTNERLTARLFSPEGVELDSDNVTITEAVPNQLITDLNMVLDIPQNAEDGTYDVRLEVNPMRDSDPSNNILTLQVRVGEPFDLRQFEIIDDFVDLCADPSKVDWTDCSNSITINGTTLRNIMVSDRTNNIRFDGPDGTQIIGEDEIVYWEASGAALAVLGIFGDTDPDANVAVVYTARAAAGGPQFSERVYVAPKGEQTRMIATRGTGPRFDDRQNHRFFIPYDVRVNVSDEMKKLQDWSANRPSVQDNGSNWSLDFSIPSSADIGRSWMYIRTDHENRRTYLTEVALQVVGVPKISLSEDDMELSVVQGDTVHAEFQISNTGEERLNWSTEVNEDYLILENNNGSINPGSNETITFSVHGNALDSGSHDKTIWIDSNDPQNSRVGVSLLIDVLPMPLSPPVDFTAVEGNGDVYLTWNINTEPALAGYEIYRGYRPDSLDTVITLNDFNPVNNEIGYIDNNVINDTTYYYALRAFGSDGQLSESTDTVSVTPFDPASLRAVLSGSVFGLDEEPLPYAFVHVSKNGHFLKRMRTNENGHFNFVLDPGSYEVKVETVQGLLFFSSKTRIVDLNESQNKEVDVDLKNGVSVEIIDAKLDGGGDFIQMNKDSFVDLYAEWNIWSYQDGYLVIGLEDSIVAKVPVNASEIPGEKGSIDLEIPSPQRSGEFFAVFAATSSKEEAVAHYNKRTEYSEISFAHVNLLLECDIIWQLAINAQYSSKLRRTLIIGQTPDSDDGLVLKCGERNVSAQFEDSMSDAWWFLPDEQIKSFVHYRSNQSSEPLTWLLRIHVAEGDSPAILRWDSERLPPEQLVIRDQATEGDLINLDMKENNELFLNSSEILEIILGEATPTNALEEDIPQSFVLKQNYPNPFNPSTNVRFAIPERSFVRLVVYDLLGQQVSVIVNEELPQGWHNVTVDASNLASGVYIYRIEAGKHVDVKKMLFLK